MPLFLTLHPPTLRLRPLRRVLGPAFGALALLAFVVPPDLGGEVAPLPQGSMDGSSPSMKLSWALLGVMLWVVGCGDDQATKFCLGADGTSQDCAIGCKTAKNKKACDKWAEKTRELCPKVGKEKCQEICEKDGNPTACELAKSM